MSEIKRRKVVLITTYFPPIQSIASNRMFAFAKYLDHSSYDLTIVTLDGGMNTVGFLSEVEIIRLKNRPFIGQMNHRKGDPTIIRKAKSLYNKIYSRAIKYIHNNWKYRAIKTVERIIQEFPYPVIISSYAPVEAHLVALELKNRGCEFKWVVDFRDEMSLNPYNPEYRKKDIVKAEKSILKKADALTTVSPNILNDFRNLVNGNNIFFQEIRNGFDFDLSYEHMRAETFTMDYYGQIYASTDLSLFFDALCEILQRNLIPELQIKLIGAGNIKIPIELGDTVKVFERIPHDEAIARMKQAETLLFLLPHDGRKGVFSGKLFEYIGAMRPIVAITDPNDVAARLVEDCNAGFVADFNNKEQIIEAMLKAYNLWKNKEELPYNTELIVKHHRKNQVAKLNQLLSKL